MNPQKQAKDQSRWLRVKTLLLTTLMGWIPLPLGILLRSVLYRLICSRIGKSVKIQPQVNFTNASCVELGNEVTISQGVCLDVRQANQIYLDDQAYLDRDVRISCIGNGGKVYLGKKTRLDRGVDLKVHQGGHTEIGEQTYIGPYTCLSGYGNIQIGKNCLIASHSSLYAHNYNFADATRPIKEQGFTYKGIVIEDDCWLGSGVRVLDGVTIGQGSVIGAGAVVTKDIPPYSVAVGVPAKVISQRLSEKTLTKIT
ncbi:MAG: acyltransferase [Chroococcales cyanobacterium]